MNAEELMIGDQVHLRYTDGSLHLVTVTGIYDGQVFVTYIGIDNHIVTIRVNYESIIPIEIDPTILTKLGFRLSQRDHMHGTLLTGLWRIEYKKSTSQSGKVLGFQKVGFASYNVATYNLPLPRYVHQLQHAFKLCRVEFDFSRLVL